VYTQFSKNAAGVYDFYHRYFTNESRDIGADLFFLFRGFRHFVTHPQQVLIALRLLSTKFSNKDNKPVCFIGNTELLDTIGIMTDFFTEQMFSNRYLCAKFVLKMISLYTDKS
jgi:hypothetical protein